MNAIEQAIQSLSAAKLLCEEGMRNSAIVTINEAITALQSMQEEAVAIAALCREVSRDHPETNSDWFDHTPLRIDSATHKARSASDNWECMTVYTHPQSPAVVKAVNQAFITSESGNGQYKVILKFKSLQEMQDAHNWLVRLTASGKGE